MIAKKLLLQINVKQINAPAGKKSSAFNRSSTELFT